MEKEKEEEEEEEVKGGGGRGGGGGGGGGGVGDVGITMLDGEVYRNTWDVKFTISICACTMDILLAIFLNIESTDSLMYRDQFSA